jgi:hypothetical protein
MTGRYAEAARLRQEERLALLAEMIDGFTSSPSERLAAAPSIALVQSKTLLNPDADPSGAMHWPARHASRQSTSPLPNAPTASSRKTEPVFTGGWMVT